MPQLQFSCPENILAQPKTETGHFCKSCSKDVIDFRNFSAKEMRDYFKNNRKTHCGIFKPDQLQNPTQSIVSTIFRFAFGLVFLLGIDSTQLFAQDTTDTLQIQEPLTNYIEITGQLTDSENAEGVPFVKIVVLYNQQQIGSGISDPEGNYVLKIDSQYAGQNLQITFRFVGYEMLLIDFNTGDKKLIELPVEMTLRQQLVGLVGLIIVDPEKQATIPRDPYDFGKTVIRGEDLRNRQR